MVGTGTTWRSGVYKPDKGHIFWGPDGRAYEVDYVESDTALYLVTAYVGGSATGQAYSIVISITGQVPAFSRELSAFVAYHQGQMDGWQQLLTGTGDVTLTAPDGTKKTVPSWDKVMNAGYGVVAQAKTEADRAKLEAQSAAVSAAEAGNAVVAAALPLPDVWAPLSDSLRLITGYGRDVLVGSDVVARMVNFSRSTTKTYRAKDGTLKVAAVNEPAFEAEGLLIEGQSTNIVPSSEGTTFSVTNTSFHNITNNIAGVLPVVGQRVTFLASAGETNADVVQFVINAQGGTTYTFSFFIKQESGIVTPLESVIDVYTPVGVSAKSRKVVTDFGGGICLVSLTFTTNGSGSITLYPRLNKQGNDQKVFVVGGCQVEALPFASSYIPTNGASVTRAADVCWIPNALNVTPDYGDITITAEVRRNIAIPSNLFPRVINISERQFVVADSTRIMARGGGLDQVSLATAATGKLERVAATVKGNTIACFLNGAKATLPQTPILPVSNGVSCFIGSRNGLDGLFGHIRNVRIWQRTLSDDQIKAAS